MSQVPEIPGYYYDDEKRKYFKIQANAPSSSAYSSQDVKRRKIDDENKKAQSLAVQRNIGRIRRARILEAPIAGGFLSVGFGQSNLRAVSTSVYAQNLIKTGDTALRRCGGKHLFVVMPQRSGSSIRFSMAKGHKIEHFSADWRTKADGHPMKNVFENNMTKWGTSVPFFQTVEYGDVDYIRPQITSFSANETTEHIVTTWSGAPADRGIAISSHPNIVAGQQRYSERITDILLGPGTTQGKVDILSSTSSPPSSQDMFAIGSSEGILVIDKHLDMSWIRGEPSKNTFENYQNHPRDVFALAYLPNHRDILLAGERSGIFNIIDLRLPRFGPAAEKVQHTSCIAHIKPLDDNRILVAGCASDLCQYDRRFIKLKTDRPLFSTARAIPTRPFLTYPDYRNNGIVKTALDVDLELGIIAAVDDSSTLKLFSLHGGKVLSGFNFKTRSTLECVKFVQDEPYKSKSLWATLSDNFVRLSFDKEETPSGLQDSWRSNLYDINLNLNPPTNQVSGAIM
ncbi:hypothetical protein DSL72_006126 [Monilinia vaccinii-corymbosi]|uniref:Myocyte-specific enhancer factor 2d n=1 Tax=Monilinia vaccinii-corymbosi TaxID=61207 RepID=A0A8A3PGV7_9HELO|nr:hypothetical protein DSL72_006126 [Monilinia vaccinii-corymbosi]